MAAFQPVDHNRVAVLPSALVRIIRGIAWTNPILPASMARTARGYFAKPCRTLINLARHQQTARRMPVRVKLTNGGDL